METRAVRRAALWLLCLTTIAGRAGAQEPLRVAAAADLAKAFREVGAAYEKKTQQKVELTIASSGQLTKQIENGAPYDVFAAANDAYVDRLDKAHLVVSGTKQVYALGRLALWTRKGGPPHPKTLDALTDPRYARIAIANPQVAPYGMAAEEALKTAKVYDRVQAKLVFGENIQQAFQMASTGNADVGLVSLSLATDSDGTWTRLPEKLYHPLRQTLAVLTASKQPANARRFTAFILGREGRAILHRYGLDLGKR